MEGFPGGGSGGAICSDQSKKAICLEATKGKELSKGDEREEKKELSKEEGEGGGEGEEEKRGEEEEEEEEKEEGEKEEEVGEKKSKRGPERDSAGRLGGFFSLSVFSEWTLA